MYISRYCGQVTALRMATALTNQPVIVTTIQKHVDEPTQHFNSRTELLSRIHDRLSECYQENHHVKRIVLLCGLGGIGKSELARKYVANYVNTEIIQNVAWINAETENSLKESFTDLAKNLGIKSSTESENIKEIVRNVYLSKPSFSWDIWSLGVIVYEVFTRLQWDLAMELRMCETRNDYDTAVKERITQLPESVTSVVSKCLDFDPVARPSAQELFDFFNDLLTKLN